jgi:hypothetical protein
MPRVACRCAVVESLLHIGSIIVGKQALQCRDHIAKSRIYELSLVARRARRRKAYSQLPGGFSCQIPLIPGKELPCTDAFGANGIGCD